MKKIFLTTVFLMILSCSNNKSVYWCGDHPCINNKEKEAYFKKNMTVEIRNYNKLDQNKRSEIDKITKQARINEKKRIKEEKELAKQIKLEEKREIKEKKKRLKEENKRANLKNKESKKNKLISEEKIAKKKIVISTNNVKLDTNSPEFKNLMEKIIKKNKTRPYPSLSGIEN